MFQLICHQCSLSFCQFLLVSFRFFYVLLICHPRNVVLLYIPLTLASCISFLSFFPYATTCLLPCPALVPCSLPLLPLLLLYLLIKTSSTTFPITYYPHTTKCDPDRQPFSPRRTLPTRPIFYILILCAILLS